jgi:HK97 family phage major capsid protein
MSDLQEIKGLVEKINPTLVELRSEIDAMKAAAPKDVVTEEKHQRMADDITAKMADMQAKQAKLEAALNRPDGGEGKGMDVEMEAKHRDLFRDYMAYGKADGLKETREGIEIKAMSTDVNPDGGYLVRPELSSTIVSRIFETSPLRQVANVERTGGKSIDILIDDNEAGARWVGEGASGGQTDTPQIGQKVIAAHKIEADPRMTTEMIEDAYLNVEAWLAGKVADKFARTQNTAFVNGTGTGQPRGFLTYAAWAAAGVYERDKIEQINMGSAAALNADGLIEVQNALKEGYQAPAVWGMKRTTFGAALQLKGNDNYFFSPVLMANGQASIQLLGKPVVFMDDMPAVAANALSIVYADFRVAYTILDRVGLQVLRDPFTNKGFITYYTTQRVGGDVTNFDGIKIGKVAA